MIRILTELYKPLQEKEEVCGGRENAAISCAAVANQAGTKRSHKRLEPTFNHFISQFNAYFSLETVWKSLLPSTNMCARKGK